MNRAYWPYLFLLLFFVNGPLTSQNTAFKKDYLITEAAILKHIHHAGIKGQQKV